MGQPSLHVGYAITILRQGKSHPRWREAAHYLLDHAAKDTQLLLDAQRELLLSEQPSSTSRMPWGGIGLGLALVLIMTGSLYVIWRWRILCGA